MSTREDITLYPLKEIKKIWDNALLDKKITKTIYDDRKFLGFYLEDGTKVTYDPVIGLEIMFNQTTGETLRYN